VEQPRNDKRPGQKRQPKGVKILHEDKDVIVVNKPSGLLTVGTDRDKSRTVHYLLNDYVRKGDPKSRQRVYVVHRLDQETSGLLLFAKSEQAKEFLQKNWEETDKHYLAIVHGHLLLKEGEICSRLMENAAYKVYTTDNPTEGRLAKTAYKVLKVVGAFSLLEIHLLTGRKHQIRVQFADKGHPVVGDTKYGNRAPMLNRLALHARSIRFIHPFNGRILTFDTGVPDDFVRMLGRLQR